MFVLIVGVAALLLIVASRIWKLPMLRELSAGLGLVAISSCALWSVERFGDPEPWRQWTEVCLALAVGYVLAKGLILVVVEWLLVQRAGVEVPRLGRDVAALVVYLVMAAAILRAVLGIEVGALLATSAVLTVVIGLALQETLGTLLAGVALAWEKRLQAGEWIEFDGHVARIEELGWRSLMARTRLNEQLLIPNSDAVRARVKMLGRGKRPVAVQIYLSVAYAAPPFEVTRVLEKVARDLPGVEKEPAPHVLASEFADSGIVYEARLWTRTPWHDYDLKNVFLTRAYAALGRAHMEIPFPQRTVHLARPPDVGDAEAGRRVALAASPLFTGLDDESLDVLAARSVTKTFVPGELVVLEGEASDALYVITSGEVIVELSGRELSRLDSGEVFGERAMLTGEPRSADVRAATLLQVLEVDRGALAGVIGINEALADKLADRMAARDPVTGEPSTAINLQSDHGVVAQIRHHLLRLVGKG